MKMSLFLILSFFCFVYAAKDPSIRFAALGDFGLPEPGTKAVAELIKSWNPDFIISQGDDDYTDGTFEGLDAVVGQFYHEFVGNYKGKYGQGSDENRFWPIPSDHSFGDDCSKPSRIAAHLDFYTLPDSGSPQSFDGELNYWFREGPVLFFMINSMDCFQPGGSGPDSPLAHWVDSVAQQSDAPFKLISLHHTPYTSGRYRPGAERMRWDFEGMGINVVIAGNDHTYERFHIGKTLYFTNGLGGVDMRELNSPRLYGSQASFTGKYGAMLIEADNDSMVFRFYTHDGELIDTYTLLQGGPAVPSPPDSVTGIGLKIDEIQLNWIIGSENTERFEIERSKNDTLHFEYVGAALNDKRQYIDRELEVNQSYYYRIRAYNLGGFSGYTYPIEATTLTRPEPPQGLTIDSVSFDFIKISWEKYADTTGNTIEIERKISMSPRARFMKIKTLGINNTTFSNSGLKDSTYYSYRLRVNAYRGYSLYSDTIATYTFKAPADIEPSVTQLPTATYLKQNYPNPFNPNTVISYQLSAASRVELTVYNVLGQKIATLVDEKQQAGIHSVRFNPAELADGVYLYRLSTDNGYSATRKMLLIR